LNKRDVVTTVLIASLVYIALTAGVVVFLYSARARVVADVEVTSRSNDGYQFRLYGKICFQDLNGTVVFPLIPSICLPLGERGSIPLEFGHTYTITVTSGSYAETVQWAAPKEIGIDRIDTTYFIIDIVVYKSSVLFA
jgi:hypothetical protein